MVLWQTSFCFSKEEGCISVKGNGVLYSSWDAAQVAHIHTVAPGFESQFYSSLWMPVNVHTSNAKVMALGGFLLPCERRRLSSQLVALAWVSPWGSEWTSGWKISVFQMNKIEVKEKKTGIRDLRGFTRQSLIPVSLSFHCSLWSTKKIGQIHFLVSCR